MQEAVVRVCMSMCLFNAGSCGMYARVSVSLIHQAVVRVSVSLIQEAVVRVCMHE